jgi:hypothetical protein
MYERDPVSVYLDRGARQFLTRVYAHPGDWVSTRLADPTPAQVAHFGRLGIDVLEADRAPAYGPATDRRNRWARAFVRALYHQHDFYSELGGRGWRATRRSTKRTAGALKIDVDGHRPELGVIPSGRIVRAVLFAGGRAADAAAVLNPAPAADAAARDW